MSIALIIITILSCVMSGMGIGGGSIFILLVTIFDLITYKEAIVYSLLMFVISGVSSSFNNYKNKLIDKNLFKKLLIPICFGSITGSYIVKNINEKNLKLAFYVFVIILGIYEIISSLKNILYSKNNNIKWKEWFYEVC